MSKGKKKINLTPGQNDEMWSIMHRILESQNFESEEDLNRFLQENFTGKRIENLKEEFPIGTTPQQEAQDLVYEAYRSPRLKAKSLIKKALKIDPNCIEAYVFKGETQSSSRSGKRWYLKAIETAEKVWGKEFFEENKGHFWSMAETRPFMRAKLNLALCLRNLGDTDEAIQHMRELLELNPNDNQGVRYELLILLLQKNLLKEATRLYNKYPDDYSANWHYNRAILIFKKEGNTTRAKKLLRAGIKFNPHVMSYLTGRKRMPLRRPDHYGIGDEKEAYFFLESAGEMLEKVGVKDWMVQVYNEGRKRKK